MHDFLFLPRRRKEVERQSRSALCRLLPRRPALVRTDRGAAMDLCRLSFSGVRYIKLPSNAPVPPLLACFFRSRRVRRDYDSRRTIVVMKQLNRHFSVDCNQQVKVVITSP